MATADEPARKPTAPPALYGGPAIDRVTIRHLHAAKAAGERWPMLTAYDVLTAQIFDQAGIPVLLVGDSAANNVLGYVDTLGITVDELLPLCRAVSRGAQRAMVVADLPFGSYQSSPQIALDTATRFVKESGAHAIKLEGGARVAEHVALISGAGVPVMAHIGFTPQSVHATSGYRVQGRGNAGDQLVRDAVALQDAGAFAVVLEMVPAATAARVTAELAIPTIGIGAGAECDAQVMVWQDMAGLREGPLPKFVKQYADLRGTLSEAVSAFANDVRDRRYPDEEHSYH